MNIRDRRHPLTLLAARLLAPLAGVQAAGPPPPDIIRALKPLSVRGVNWLPRHTPVGRAVDEDTARSLGVGHGDLLVKRRSRNLLNFAAK